MDSIWLIILIILAFFLTASFLWLLRAVFELTHLANKGKPVKLKKHSVKKRKLFESNISKHSDETMSNEMIPNMYEKQASVSSDCISDEGESVNYEDAICDDSACFENVSSEKVKKPMENLEFDKFMSYIDEDSLKNEMNEAGILPGLNKYINDSIEKWKQIELNIAVTGNSGTGKSSLINTLRNLKPSDEGAAAVDVIEATDLGTKYTYPENPNVALWDLPGTGTQKFTKEKYLHEMDFTRFEVVIIVSAGRFLENDIWLAKEVRAIGKNVIFVRTKIDIDMMNARRDFPETFNEEGCLKKIRENLFKNIRVGGISESGVFLVSSPDRNSFDFTNLDKSLRSMLNIKGKAIRSLVQKHVITAIRNDQQINKNEFKVRKAVSVIYGFLPIPNLETGLGNLSVSRIRDICLQKFCIDENSLDEMADELNISKTILKMNLKSYNNEDIEDSLLVSIERKRWPSVRIYAKYIIPVVGMFLSAHKTYVTTNECLKKICNEMAEDELALAILRLKRLEDDLTPI